MSGGLHPPPRPGAPMEEIALDCLVPEPYWQHAVFAPAGRVPDPTWHAALPSALDWPGHREGVAVGVLEPGDTLAGDWRPDPELVLDHVVALESDAAPCKLAD